MNAWLDEIVLDRAEPIPLVEQIANAIRNKIATGRIGAGEMLPSVRSLGVRLGTTPVTVARAYQQLKAEGLLTANAGVGTTVVDVQAVNFAARSSARSSAERLLADTVKTMSRMGLDRGEVAALLRAAAARHAAATEPYRCAFVASRRSSFRRFEVQIRDALAALDVEIVPVHFEDLLAGVEEALAAARSADSIITLLTYERHIGSVLSQDAPEVFIVIAELALSTVDELIAIPRDKSVLFVTESAYRPTGLGLLQSYCAPESIVVARDLSPKGLRDFAAKHAPIVVVHTGDVEGALEQADLGSSAVRLEFQIRQDSLDRLREGVAARSRVQVAAEAV